MEFVINYMLIMIGVTILALIYAGLHKTNEKKVAVVVINKNFKINTKDNDDDYKIVFKMIGIIGAVIITIFIISKLSTSNPIIGKWRSEKSIPFMGKMINEIEFTKDRAYSMGIVSNVNYEIDDNKIIVTDGMGIGVVYEMIDENTMKNNMLGMGETIYRRIK